MEPPPKKLLDQVRDAIRLKYYSIRTEGEVHLPYALERKYPNAGHEWIWQSATGGPPPAPSRCIPADR